MDVLQLIHATRDLGQCGQSVADTMKVKEEIKSAISSQSRFSLMALLYQHCTSVS